MLLVCRNWFCLCWLSVIIKILGSVVLVMICWLMIVGCCVVWLLIRFRSWYRLVIL